MCFFRAHGSRKGERNTTQRGGGEKGGRVRLSLSLSPSPLAASPGGDPEASLKLLELQSLGDSSGDREGKANSIKLDMWCLKNVFPSGGRENKKNKKKDSLLPAAGNSPSSVGGGGGRTGE